MYALASVTELGLDQHFIINSPYLTGGVASTAKVIRVVIKKQSKVGAPIENVILSQRFVAEEVSVK